MRIVKKYQGGNQLTYLPYMYGADPIYYATLPQNKVLPEDTKQDLAKANFKLRMASLLPFLGLTRPVQTVFKLTQPSTYIQKIAGFISPRAEIKAASSISPIMDMIANIGYGIPATSYALYEGLNNLTNPDVKNKANAIVDTGLGALGFLTLLTGLQSRGLYSASKRLKERIGFDVNRPAYVRSTYPNSDVSVHQLALDENGNPLIYEKVLSQPVLEFLKKYRKPKNPYIYRGTYFNTDYRNLRSNWSGLAEAGPFTMRGIGTVNETNPSIVLHEIGGHGTETERGLKPYYEFLSKYSKIFKKYPEHFTHNGTFPHELRATAIESMANGVKDHDLFNFFDSVDNMYADDWLKFLKDPRVQQEKEYADIVRDLALLLKQEGVIK